MQLDGVALQWHQSFLMDEREDLGRNQYLTALKEGFGETVSTNPLAELINLRQTGLVREYQDHFDTLYSRARISEH